MAGLWLRPGIQSPQTSHRLPASSCSLVAGLALAEFRVSPVVAGSEIAGAGRMRDRRRNGLPPPSSVGLREIADHASEEAAGFAAGDAAMVESE